MNSAVDTLGTVYKVLGAIQIILGGLAIMLACAANMIPIMSGGLDDEQMMIAGASIVGGMGCALVLILGIGGLTFMTGGGLQQRKGWARTAAFVLSVLSMCNFPIGTAIAVYTFMTLTKEEVKSEFGG